jgi:hypothetical protein
MPPFGPLCRWDTWIPHFVLDQLTDAVLDQLTDAGRQGLKSRLSRRLVVNPSPTGLLDCPAAAPTDPP